VKYAHIGTNQAADLPGQTNSGRKVLAAISPAEFTGYHPHVFFRFPERFKAEEVESLMDSASKTKSPFLPTAAPAVFAGIRPAEICRLDWANVQLAQYLGVISGQRAKTNRFRWVPVTTTLKARLVFVGPPAGGPIVHSGRANSYEALHHELVSTAQLGRWPQDTHRHGYASIEHALPNDFERLATHIGSSVQEPRKLYAARADINEAQAFHSITPTHIIIKLKSLGLKLESPIQEGIKS
jgi:integrase